MAKSPQTFEKRQRERRKQLKRQLKRERRLEREAEKKRAKERGDLPEQPLGLEGEEGDLQGEPNGASPRDDSDPSREPAPPDPA